MNVFWQFSIMVTFGFACWAVGDLIIGIFLRKNVSLPALGRPSLAFAAGNVAMSYLLTLIGFLGGFVAIVFWAVFLGGTGLAIWRIVPAFNKSFQRPQHGPDQWCLILESNHWHIFYPCDSPSRCSTLSS